MRGLWWLENVGKAPVYVNGNAVQRFASCELTWFGPCVCGCVGVIVCMFTCAQTSPKGEPILQARACARGGLGLRSVPRAAASAAIASSFGVCIVPREPVCAARNGLRSQCRPVLRPLLACGTVLAELSAAAVCDWGGSLAASPATVHCAENRQHRLLPTLLYRSSKVLLVIGNIRLTFDKA